MVRHRHERARIVGVAVLCSVAVACGGGNSQIGPTPPPPPATTLAALTLNPSSVAGGTAVTLTATLSAAAPAAGAVVTLSSSSSAAIVPTELSLAAGAVSGTAQVATTVVNASTPVTITGTYGGASQVATLSVTPVPLAASFTVVSTSRGVDACGLGSGGVVDCEFNGSASTGSVQAWVWSYATGAQIKTNDERATPRYTPNPGCGFFGGQNTTTGQTFLQMIVRLRVRDAGGNLSAETVNQNVRVFPNKNCGYGF